jgi:hypothetical protein
MPIPCGSDAIPFGVSVESEVFCCNAGMSYGVGVHSHWQWLYRVPGWNQTTGLCRRHGTVRLICLITWLTTMAGSCTCRLFPTNRLISFTFRCLK